MTQEKIGNIYGIDIDPIIQTMLDALKKKAAFEKRKALKSGIYTLREIQRRRRREYEIQDFLENLEMPNLDLASDEAVNYVQNLSKLHEILTKSTQDTASLHAIFEAIQHRNRIDATEKGDSDEGNNTIGDDDA